MCTFKSKHLNEVHKINKKYNCDGKMAVYLIECVICRERYTVAQKQRLGLGQITVCIELLDKEAVSKKALKCFYEHYCLD